MKKSLLVLISMVLVFSLALSACSSSSEESQPDSTAQEALEKAEADKKAAEEASAKAEAEALAAKEAAAKAEADKIAAEKALADAKTAEEKAAAEKALADADAAKKAADAEAAAKAAAAKVAADKAAADKAAADKAAADKAAAEAAKPVAPKQKIELTIRTTFVGDAFAARRAWLEKYIQKFETENPGYKVTPEYLDQDSLRNKTKIEMAGGNPPDIFYTWGLAYSEPYANSGMMLDLTEELNKDPQWKNDFINVALDVYEYNGKVMGASLGGFVEGIFYNKELFTKLGLKPPATWGDIIKAVYVAKENNIVPISIGGKENFTSDWAFGTFFYRMGGQALFNDMMKGNGSFSNPDWIKAVEFIQDLNKLGAFPQGALGMANVQARSLFTSEKALMRFTGSWEMPVYYAKDLTENWGDKVGFLDIPALPDGKGDQKKMRGAYSPGIAINGKLTGDKKAGAIKLFKTITSKEALTGYVEAAGVLPAVKTDISNLKVTKLFKEVNGELSKSSGVFTTFNDLMPPGMAEVFYTVQSLSSMDSEYIGKPGELLKKLDVARKEFVK
jgi:raffinose/stachyose/melibiose transport system substrate-binding protein